MITPIEIRQHTFKRALRGYDREEVDAFLRALSQEWERQIEAQRNLKEELGRVQSSYNTLKEVENMLHKTLMQAEQSSRDALDNARQKAEIKLTQAQSDAQDIMRKALAQRDVMLQEVESLARRRDQLLIQMRGFLNTQLEYVETYESNELPPAAPQAQLPKAQPVSPPVEENAAPAADIPQKKEQKTSEPYTNGQSENFFAVAENGTEIDALLEDIMDEL